MKGIPDEHLDEQSVTILGKLFREGPTEGNAASLLAKTPELFSTVPQKLHHAIVTNIQTFIVAERRFYNIAALVEKWRTLQPLRLFLVWVII